MATVIDERAIQQILREAKLSDRKQRRRAKLRNWHISHITFRTLGYAGLFVGLFGMILVTYAFAIPQRALTMPSDIAYIAKKTRPIAASKLTRSQSSTSLSRSKIH
jgi:hypothetical protein